MSGGGYIKLYRQIREWAFWGDPSATVLWIYLLVSVNWTDGTFRGEPIERGAMVTSIEHLSNATGLSRSTIKRKLKEFEKAGMIDRKATNRWTYLKVLNYSTFQGIDDNNLNQQMSQPMNQPVNQQLDPNIRIKEIKEKKNIPPQPPQGGRGYPRRSAGIVIDTPAWYKRQQAQQAQQQAAEPETDNAAIIAEIEEMKRKMKERTK